VTVTVDINVLLDVFQNREPHYTASAQLLTLIEAETVIAVFPSHGLATLYYVVRKHGSKANAEAVMDRVLDHFRIGDLDAAGWREARKLALDDFEDAAVAAVARKSGSQYIITRDADGFDASPVPAISPTEFLAQTPDEL
jgi:predicted nucleic acid-binding protein